MKKEGRIEKLCYDYLFTGYFIAKVEDFKKKKDFPKEFLKEIEEKTSNFKKIINERLKELLKLNCNKCNSKINSEDKFCSNCGERVLTNS